MLLTMRNVTVSFGGAPLLDQADLTIEPGERICLLGRNGAGKSTLLKLLAGDLDADGGEVVRRQGLVVARLEQEVPEGAGGSVFDMVAGGLPEHAGLLGEFHRISRRLADTGEGLAQLERVQAQLEAGGGWDVNRRVEEVISRLDLPADVPFTSLSGGLKRRVLLGRALLCRPDLLLLDEPTNHLDIEAIAWLEEFLLGFSGTLLFVTHDRAFLRRLATRIVELDRGHLSSWPGDYDTYLRRREETLAAEAKQNAEFDRRLGQEESWIRQGIKARRTRNEGRVRALQAMRRERQQRRELQGSARIGLEEAGRSGRLVVETRGACFAYADKTIIDGLDTTILRGDKVGIIGPNGSGKTTLLRLLLGQLEPTAGSVRRGEGLEIAYFDQLRDQLDPQRSVIDNVAEGRSEVGEGSRRRHIISYLQDFLFTPDRANSPVRSLSGGERNRVLLAKLFTKPCNLLVMDEPTNDLDMETLDLLEDLLVEFGGTLLLVSHDRAFLDNVVTQVLVLEGEGKVGEYVGGYADWLRQRPRPVAQPAAAAVTEKKEKPRPAPAGRKLSYKDQRELEQLPGRIEALEESLERVRAQLGDPAFYQGDKVTIAATNQRLQELETELAQAYERWEALEG